MRIPRLTVVVRAGGAAADCFISEGSWPLAICAARPPVAARKAQAVAAYTRPGRTRGGGLRGVGRVGRSVIVVLFLAVVIVVSPLTVVLFVLVVA